MRNYRVVDKNGQPVAFGATVRRWDGGDSGVLEGVVNEIEPAIVQIDGRLERARTWELRVEVLM